MAMPGNSISVIEATDETVSILRKLKRDQPFGNEASSTKNKGMNGGISFDTNNGANAVITGQFDARITYLEEDDGQGGTEIVPYVQVYDSANPTNGYAGYAYVGPTSFHILASALAPMVGYVYLYIDRVSNISEIRIASSIPNIQGTVRKYAYPIAQVIYSNTIWMVRRLNLPGVIHLQEDPRGAFDVDIKYVEETENDTLVTKPYILVYDSSANNQSYAGYVYSGTSTWHLPAATLNPMAGVVYVDINYELNTRTIAIASSLPSLTTTDRRWVYALANVTYNSSKNLYSVQRFNLPGNINVSGRWVA